MTLSVADLALRCHPPGPRLQLDYALDFWARLRGLHGYPTLSAHRGLWIFPCNAVHTFRLGYAIDLVFLGADYRLLKRVERLRPNRIAVHTAARSVVELPAGYCASNPCFLLAIHEALDGF
ncbi:MAG TPA: DUF192 domain-containing protein [Eoetvoesiella sp.]